MDADPELDVTLSNGRRVVTYQIAALDRDCRFSAGWDPRFSKPFPPELFPRLTAFSVPYSAAPVQREGVSSCSSSLFILLKSRRLWECGNLACCARFPSGGGHRSVMSTGASFP